MFNLPTILAVNVHAVLRTAMSLAWFLTRLCFNEGLKLHLVQFQYIEKRNFLIQDSAAESLKLKWVKNSPKYQKNLFVYYLF